MCHSLIFNKRPKLAFYIKLTLTCSMSLEAEKIVEIVEIVPTLHQHKGKGKKALNVAQRVFVHTRVWLKGLKNGFLVGTINSRPGSCPLVKLCFLPAALSARRLSGGPLKHNTPNEMWLVPPYCSIYTGWDDIEGGMQKSAHLLLDEVWWLSKPTEESV